MKIKIVIIVICLLGLSKSLNAQTFPYWDANNPGSPAGGLAPTGSQPYMVATNGVIYALTPSGLAQWSQSSGWQLIVNGYTGSTLAIGGGSLYMAGAFNSIPGLSSSFDNVAVLNLTTYQWTDLGYGQLTNTVYAIIVDAHTNVYVCCNNWASFPYGACDDFSPTATPVTNVFLELKYNTTNWVTVGGGLADLGGYASQCVNNSSLMETADPPLWYILATDGTNIVMANNFLYGVNTNGTMVFSPFLIEWNGTNWVALGTNAPVPGLFAPLPINNTIVTNIATWADSVVVSGTNIFVTGALSGPTDGCPGCGAGYAGGLGIARFSTSGLYIPTAALLIEDTNADCGNTPPPGFAAPSVFAQLAAANGNVYVTGNFDTIQTNLSNFDSPQPDNPATSITVNGIAEFNGTNWSALSTGLQNDTCPGGGYGIVADAGAVYVQGLIAMTFSPGGPNGFTGAGGNSCTYPNYFVRWNTAPDLNLVYVASAHRLYWSYSGPQPYEWQLQWQSECDTNWSNFLWLSGDSTSISTLGLGGTFQIRGCDGGDSPVTDWSNIQNFNDTSSGNLTLTYTSSTHTLSWTWNGQAPVEWVIQSGDDEFSDYDDIDGSQTSINVTGWDGIFRIYGASYNGCPTTPYSNTQAFDAR